LYSKIGMDFEVCFLEKGIKNVKQDRIIEIKQYL
jgi:hypothetical protein